MPFKGDFRLTQRVRSVLRTATLWLSLVLCISSFGQAQQLNRAPAPSLPSTKTASSSVQPKATASDAGNNTERVPLVILVINRETNDVHVYPGQAVVEFKKAFPLGPSDESFLSTLQYVPIDKLSKSLHTSEDINSLQRPIEERAATYAQTILRNITGLHVGTSAAWSSATLKVLQRLPALDPDAEQKKGRLIWPPPFPLLMTELSTETGYLLVVEVRNGSQAGVVEKLDFMAFRRGLLSRTYWSRDMHDPTLSLPTDQAFAQVAQRFVERVKRIASRGFSPPKADQILQLEVSRMVSEAEILTLQKLVQDLGGQGLTPLVPDAVDRDFITYRSSVPPEKTGEFLAALQRELESVSASSLAGQSGTIRLTRKSD